MSESESGNNYGEERAGASFNCGDVAFEEAAVYSARMHNWEIQHPNPVDSKTVLSQNAEPDEYDAVRGTD